MRIFKFVKLAGLAWIVIVFVLATGWCTNAYKLIQLDFEAPYKTEVVRSLALVIFPIGGVVGWFTFDEEE